MEENSFNKYTFKKEFDTIIFTLEGIIKGIAIDGVINEKEKKELSGWISKNIKLLNYAVFKELASILDGLFLNQKLTEDERKNILWLCNNFKPENKYYNVITSDIIILKGILYGIMADNKITDNEIINLEKWINNNSQLKGLYPYDELSNLLESIFKDKIITEEEKSFLKVFISQFIDLEKSENIDADEINELKKTIMIKEICEKNPVIDIKNNSFCYTGKSSKNIKEIINIVELNGGFYNDNVSDKTKYLIVGIKENPCWAYSFYGKKIEDAIILKNKGYRINIICENDFWKNVK
jgi:hypothetical protein